MMQCSECQAEITAQTRYCPRCGSATPRSPATAIDAEATTAWAADTRAATQGGDGDGATDLGNGGAIPIGTVLQGRYRIVSRLGAGGMGSVYRAVDETLGQEVALKFLAENLAGDPASATLLTNEVRTARKVTHPNVCRVHDLGTVAGRTFISMEYVDGEDLSALMRRIGRLSEDKATQLARQLCAGLHAAHERGVLHRDLKPANVMIDSAGNAKITDFGIAAAMESAHDSGTTPGTPAYMAPELFTGGSASVQSDLYSLGLVLYEMYTGVRLFQAKSMTELLRHHRRPVSPPSALVPGLDHKIESAILACLAHDPAARPASAMALLASLPGGDPLAEALASGKTPSPELVATAGGPGVLSWRHAAALGAIFVIGLAVLLHYESEVKFLSRAAPQVAPEVLADRVQAMLSSLGYSAENIAATHGFEVDTAVIDRRTPAAARAPMADPRSGALTYWYRQLPAPAHLTANNIKGRIAWDDPAGLQPGEIKVRTDTSGRLLCLVAEPVAGEASVAADPERLFDFADLPFGEFVEVSPAVVPPTYADRRLAWNGPSPKPPHHGIRVEAAFYRGHAVAFAMRDTTVAETPAVPGYSWRYLARGALALIAIAMAWRSVRRRRGDVRGALRMGLVLLALVVAFTVLAGDTDGYWPNLGTLLIKGMSHGVTLSIELSLYYIAVEPHVRRLWPETMISWSRLLQGRWRDPLVGHHVLAGCAFGMVAVFFELMRRLVPAWIGETPPPPLLLHPSGIEALSGPAPALGCLLEITVDSTRQALMFFVALVLLKLLLRRRVLVVLASSVVWASIWSYQPLGAHFPWLPAEWFVSALMAVTVTCIGIWLGLLPILVGFLTFGVMTTLPLDLLGATWHADAGIIALAATSTLVVFGVRTATRPMVR